MIGDRLHEVGLPQARFAVDKEGIEAFARVFRHRFRRGVYEFVGRAYDKGIEREIFVDGHGLEIVRDVLFLFERVRFAPFDDQPEIGDAAVAFGNGVPKGNGVLFHDGVGGEFGGGFEVDAPIDDIHGFEVFYKRVERNRGNDSLRFVPNLFP